MAKMLFVFFYYRMQKKNASIQIKNNESRWVFVGALIAIVIYNLKGNLTNRFKKAKNLT